MKTKRTARNRPRLPIFWVTIVIGVSFCLLLDTGSTIAKFKYANTSTPSTVGDDDTVNLTSLWI